MTFLSQVGAFLLGLIALATFAYYLAKRPAKSGGTPASSGGDRLFFLLHLVLLGKTLPKLDAELAVAEERIRARRRALALKGA